MYRGGKPSIKVAKKTIVRGPRKSTEALPLVCAGVHTGWWPSPVQTTAEGLLTLSGVHHATHTQVACQNVEPKTRPKCGAKNVSKNVSNFRPPVFGHQHGQILDAKSGRQKCLRISNQQMVFQFVDFLADF